MKPLVLYCKSYRTDLKRVIRLAKSIREFNAENLPFFISVPKSDLQLFKQHLDDLNVEIIADEEIVAKALSPEIERLAKLPGSISQQVVKSEFWRLGISASYLCIDSDSLFIRPFGLSDFLTPEGTPYTMIDEGRSLLDDALLNKKPRILKEFIHEAGLVQDIFARKGKRYSFGPFPVVWHRNVWESLCKEYLEPRKMNLVDAIVLAPIESRWYGEALLKFAAIPLIPCQPLFKVYHYAWQLDHDLRARIGNSQLADLYLGVIYQSAWEREMDWPREGGSLLSHMARRIRRQLGRN